MNKEKIKELKKLRQDFWHHEKRKEYQLADEVLHTIANHYLDWLIEQAERVQELEDKLARIRFVNNDYDKQNKRYREALEFYAKPKNWLPQNEDVLSLITMDYGEKARGTLEGEE